MIPFTTSVPTSRIPLTALSMIAMCLLVFVLELELDPVVLQQVIEHLGVVPQRFLNAQWVELHLWLVPMFTSTVLHGGLAHLIGNLVFLWVFAGPVESRMGHGRFAILLAIAAMSAATLQAWMNPSSQTPMVGASGVVAGVLGAYLALYPLSRVVVLVPLFLIPLFFEVPALLFIGFWVLQNLLAGAIDSLTPTASGIAWWAHIGGYLAGSLLVRVMCRRDSHGHRPGHYNHRRYRVRRERY